MVGGESKFSVEIEQLSDRAAVLRLTGEIDMLTAPEIVPSFQALADRGLTDVIVDATQVGFMDSSGIAALGEGRRTIFEKGSSVALVSSPAVQRILDIAFPNNEFIPRFDTIAEAAAHLGLN